MDSPRDASCTHILVVPTSSRAQAHQGPGPGGGPGEGEDALGGAGGLDDDEELMGMLGGMGGDDMADTDLMGKSLYFLWFSDLRSYF